MTDSFRRIVRTGLAPLMEDVPEGPEWSDLTPETTLVPSRSARSGWLAGVGAAVVVLVVIGAMAFLTGEEPVPPPATGETPTTGATSTTAASSTVTSLVPEDTEAPRFVPNVSSTGSGLSSLDVVFLDGTTANLSWPEGLDLLSEGVTTHGWGGLNSLGSGTSRTISARPEPADSVVERFGGGELLATYPDGSGGTVEFRRFPVDATVDYLVFNMGAWTVLVYDYQSGPDGRMRESSRETWASSLSGETSPEGFLSLSADPPLVLAGSGASPPVNLGFESPNGIVDITLFACSPNEIIEDEAQSITWCDQSGRMLVAIHSTDAAFRNLVRESLTISDIRESPWGTPEDPPETTTTTLAAQVPAAGPIFGEETGMVLLLDDGLEGLTAVDPDARRAARSPVTGQRPGDEPFSMAKVGDKLVVGWATIHVVDIATRQSLSLGSATVFVPSATEDNVWMIDYPGGSIGSGRPTVWQVNTSGETTIEPRELNSNLIPLLGIEGGLALQTNQGIELWDVATGEIHRLAGDGGGFARDVSGDTLAWCSGDCPTLNLTNTSDLTTEELPAPAGMVYLDAGFSDDGRYLAAILADESSFQGEAVLLLDRNTGDIQTISSPGAPAVRYVAWAPDNDQLFATEHTYGEGTTPIWNYRISTGELETAVIPVGGAITPVVIDRSVANEYFTADVEDF